MSSNLPAKQQAFLNVKALMEKMKGQLINALPKHLTPDRMIRVFLTEINKNPKLLECTQQSLIGALIQASQLGLEPGLLGQVYLIPFKNKNGSTEVQFIIGYKGMIDLARRSGDLVTIYAQEVRENDEFEYSFGVEGKLFHKPAVRNRGEIIGYYSFAQLKDGGFAYEFMSYDEVIQHRDKFSKAKNYGPWASDFDAMAKKTLVRQLMKWLPLSIEIAENFEKDNSISKTDLTTLKTEIVLPEYEAAEEQATDEILQENEPEELPTNHLNAPAPELDLRAEMKKSTNKN